MKILYLGNDTDSIASALRGIQEDVTVLVGSHLDQAARWLDENPELAAVVLEAQLDGGDWRSVLTNLGAARPAVIVIVPEGTGALFESLEPGAGAYIEKGHSLFPELQTAVARAVAPARVRDLERKLAHATAELQDAERRHQAAMSEATAQIAQRQAQYEIADARASAIWEMVDEQLRAAALEVERARHGQASADAEADRLRSRDAELSSRVAEAEAAVVAATARAEQERAAAAGRLAERERELQVEIAQESDKRRGVDASLARAKRDLEEAQKRHESAMSGASAHLRELEEALRLAEQDADSTAADVERLTEREGELRSALADVTASRDDLEHRLAAREAAFRDADAQATRERLEASKRAAAREAELDGQIRMERETRAALEQALADADAALRAAQARHETALAAASTELAERQAHFDGELSRTSADRDSLAQLLSDTGTALDQARRDHHAAAASVERLTEREADLGSQLADARAAQHTLERRLADAMRAAADTDERAARERAATAERETTRESQFAEERLSLEGRLEAAEHRHRTLTLERDALQESLAASQEHGRRLDEELHDARGRFEQAQASADADIRRLTAECFETERELEDARRDFQETVDRLSREHATALAELAASVTERDSRLREQSHIQDTLTRELEAGKRRIQDLQTEADELPRLRTQLEASREECHRLFQQAGLAMFRCSRDGALIEANRACETLIGRRMIDELRGTQFASAVFEAPDVLSWLIERCVSTTARESADTTWRRQDGRRLFVRLSASVVAADLIEITAEDLTRLRVLQERLDKAHRMEAVGRLASEVAATCGNLLDDIHQNAQEWLTTAGADSASRQRGEALLEDVSRAVGLIRQLAACGEEQANAPRLVDLNTVIRDLEPVLKRVAGGDVDVRLQETPSPLNVDVGMERVERLLVNLASYGRERMPFGGRLTIELGTAVVDRHFAVKHPDVRPGLHALITVTETRRAARAAEPPRHQATARHSQGIVEPRAGVDFRTLQQLVSECGGHLWVKVQPPGDMIAKIRLPLLLGSHDEAALNARGAGVRAIVRRFRR
jgi:PAS domain-containing protein